MGRSATDLAANVYPQLSSSPLIVTFRCNDPLIVTFRCNEPPAAEPPSADSHISLQ